MFYQNTIDYSLTGTEFGFLSSYPETVYKDSYFLTDLFNRPYESYNETISGNGFFIPFNSTLIKNISNIHLWIDCTDPATYIRDGNNMNLLSGIVDKSDNNYKFVRYLDTPFIPCKSWFYSRSPFTNLDLTSVVFGEDRFISCAKNSTFFLMTTSINEFSVDWNRTGTVPINEYNKIVYGETTSQGKCFVAISSANNNFVVSRNKGNTWQLSSFSGSPSNWKGIAYGNDRFVVISNNRSMYWVTNLVSSEFVNGVDFPTGNWNDIVFGNNRFIVFGDNDKVAISDNGINWTTQVLPVTTNFITGVYGDEKYVLFGGRGLETEGLSSVDGTNWSKVNIPFNDSSAAPKSVTYSTLRGQYVLVYDKGEESFNVSYYSVNGGISWISMALPSLYNFNSVANGKNIFDIDIFVSVGNNNTTNIAVLSCPYLRSDPVGTRQWPVTCFDYTNKTALHFTRDKALFNSSFYLSLSDTYTMYMVWKDLNLYSFTIPFGFNSVYNGLTGEFILRKDYDSFVFPELPEGSIGVRGTNTGYRIESYFDQLSTNNITLWIKNSADFLDLSANSLFVNNTSINLSSYYFTPIDTVLGGSKIGYLSGSNENNFYLCEILMFNKLLNLEERGLVTNYISNKYCFPYYFENLVYTSELTGGPFSNYSYEDYSVLTSIITLPVQSCITLLNISLSSFETSKSNISKVVYSCGDVYGSIDGSFDFNPGEGNSSIAFDKNKLLQFYVVPSVTQTIQSYFIYLSVFRSDTTLNKIILSGSLLKCGIGDLYDRNKFVDSQIVDDSREMLLVTENLDRNMLYLNKINIDIPIPALSGGDEKALVNTDFDGLEEDIILLSDLLEERVEEKFRRPFFIPVPAPRTNPIRPE